MIFPIAQKGSCLIVRVPSALSDGNLIRLHGTLLRQLDRLHSAGIIVDLSALDVIDSFATRTLRDLAAKIRRRGAEMVVVGIQPDVAIAALRLGFKLDSVTTALSLDEGLAYFGERFSLRSGAAVLQGRRTFEPSSSQ